MRNTKHDKRNQASRQKMGFLPISDEDLCVAYASSINKAVVAERKHESRLEGLEHLMFLVLYAGSRRRFSRFSVPFAWAPADSLEDVERVLSESFSACVASDFAPSDDPIYKTMVSFGLGFKRRLEADMFDDRRIRNVILFIGHPHGFGVVTSLRGPRDWEVSHLAKDLRVSLPKKEQKQHAY